MDICSNRYSLAQNISASASSLVVIENSEADEKDSINKDIDPVKTFVPIKISFVERVAVQQGHQLTRFTEKAIINFCGFSCIFALSNQLLLHCSGIPPKLKLNESFEKLRISIAELVIQGLSVLTTIKVIMTVDAILLLLVVNCKAILETPKYRSSTKKVSVTKRNNLKRF